MQAEIVAEQLRNEARRGRLNIQNHHPLPLRKPDRE